MAKVMTLNDVKHGQCFRFKGQKAIYVLAKDDYITQVIGGQKGEIGESFDFGLDRQIEIVKVVEIK